MSTKIFDYDVHFPIDKIPFPSQIAVITKTLQALNLKQNALLESPTGTGKTLALLTATLCWQYNQRIKIRNESLGTKIDDKSTNNASNILQNHDHNKENCTSHHAYYNIKEDAANGSGSSSEVDRHIPSKTNRPTPVRIFFCSRTHSQLKQVIAELEGCHPMYTSGIKMCLLGSRTQLCVNKSVRRDSNDEHVVSATPSSQKGRSFGKLVDSVTPLTATSTFGTSGNTHSIDESCRNLLEVNRCPYAFRSHSLAESLTALGVWDIEEATKLGNKEKGCPYFASRSLLHDAHIAFAPYNFILDANIRKQLKIDLSDTIVVFDEAHNIEDVARAAASATLPRSMLATAVTQMKLLASTGVIAFRSLLELLESLLAWFDEVAAILRSSPAASDSHENVWTGEDALQILDARCGLNTATLPVYEQHFQTVMTENEDTAILLNSCEGDDSVDDEDDHNQHTTGKLQYENSSKEHRLAPASCFAVKSLLLVMRYMLGRDAHFAADYRMVIQTQSRRQRSGHTHTSSEATLHFWCLNAAVVFTDLDELTHSLLLTSGTLAPMQSFAKELGIPFPVGVETGHVIDVNAQLFTGAFAYCTDTSLLATYANHDNTSYQDALGKCLHAVCNVSPGGVLMFFPSYGLLDKVYNRWTVSGLVKHMANNDVEIFIEPKDSKSLSKVLELYKTAVSMTGKAVLIAVCRGKVSEGIDFSDRFARAVLIVGIPYPSTQDLSVNLKKQHQNDKAKLDSRHCTGEQWYSAQAFRAVNQAFGRCIRHRKDYGAILLLDPRYQKVEVKCQLSRWMRGAVTDYARVDDSIVPMVTFFRKMEAMFGKDSIQCSPRGMQVSGLPTTKAFSKGLSRSALQSTSGTAKTVTTVVDMRQVNPFTLSRRTHLSAASPVAASVSVSVSSTPSSSEKSSGSSTASSLSRNDSLGESASEVNSTVERKLVETDNHHCHNSSAITHSGMSVTASACSGCREAGSARATVEHDLSVRVERCLGKALSILLSPAFICSLESQSNQLLCKDVIPTASELPFLYQLFTKTKTIVLDGTDPVYTAALFQAVRDWDSTNLSSISATGLHTNEIWAPEDGLVYKCLMMRNSSGDESPGAEVVVAVKVLASTAEKASYIGCSWMESHIAQSLMWRLQLQSTTVPSTPVAGSSNTSIGTLDTTNIRESVSVYKTELGHSEVEEMRSSGSSGEGPLESASSQALVTEAFSLQRSQTNSNSALSAKRARSPTVVGVLPFKKPTPLQAKKTPVITTCSAEKRTPLELKASVIVCDDDDDFEDFEVEHSKFKKLVKPHSWKKDSNPIRK